MGKSWKKAGMMANAAKKGAQFTKLAKEIAVATKLGGPDPESNSRLRMAIDMARKVSCPKDTIERAIKKGSGQGDTSQIDEITYEGFGPHNVGVIVECQTDNKNRSASDLRAIFRKHGGNMGESGSVAWMFERVSLIEGHIGRDISDPEEEAIEVGANSVEGGAEEKSFAFYGAPEDLDSIRKALIGREWQISVAELSYLATNLTEVSDQQREDILKFVAAVDDHEDSHRIHLTLRD